MGSRIGLEMPKSVDEALAFTWESAPLHAKAKSDRIHIEQFRKSKKAMLIIEAENKGIKTAQERESYAYAHDDYIQLLYGLKEAVEIEETLRYRIMAINEKVGVWRTRQSTKKAEMQLAPMQKG